MVVVPTKIKIFSMFSGIGGFEKGIVNTIGNRAEFVGFSEIDKYAIFIYKKHFPNHKEYGDVANIKWSDIKNFDLLCGGFPCQAFSIAGKRGGFTDTRGTLFFEIARAAQEKLPRLLLLENVKGLLSHNKGRTFGVILNTLDEIGYDLQWQVLNSKNFGVPQNRERVFIVGHLRGTSRPKVFPIGESYTISNGRIKKELKYRNQKTVYNPDGISPTFREGHGDGVRIIDDYNHTIRKDAICGTVRQTFNNSANGNGCKLLNGNKIRKITPTECERLQGFPDGWTEGISNTQRYKCLGNAVTVNVIEVIMEKLFT